MSKRSPSTAKPEASGGHASPLEPLMKSAPRLAGDSDRSPASRDNGSGSQDLVLGTLVGLIDGGPLVAFEQRPDEKAVHAISTVDLHEAHVGSRLVLGFVGADPSRPIVLGVVREARPGPQAGVPGAVEVDSDGERMIVSAREQLVLRCGEASITLTRAGKVLIQGRYISNRSSGLVRIRGGSVQIN